MEHVFTLLRETQEATVLLLLFLFLHLGDRLQKNKMKGRQEVTINLLEKDKHEVCRL